MADSYLGQVVMTGFNFPMRYFALCDGQILNLQQNTALFSLLGTTYGGNGMTNFALPDLRGRTPVGYGSSSDAAWNPTPYTLGTVAGAETVTLASSEMPAHNHAVSVTTTALGAGRSPVGGFPARSSNGAPAYAPPGAAVNLAGVGMAGGSTPHPNMQPFNVISFSIALAGIFPSRN